MAPSMALKKKKKEKKLQKPLSAKSKSKAASQEEVERSLKIANMLLQQEEGVVHSEDEGLSDDDYIKRLKVDPIAVDKGDDGFEVDKGDEGIVKVTDVKAEVEVIDTREKRPKVANSLRSLRLAIAEKAKKSQDDRKAKVMARGGYGSDDEEE